MLGWRKVEAERHGVEEDEKYEVITLCIDPI